MFKKKPDPLADYRTGDYYANKAREYSRTQTPAENERRQQNGRRSNVSGEFHAPNYEIAPNKHRSNN